MAKKKFNVGALAYMIGFFGAIVLGILAGAGLFEIGTVLSVVLILSGVVIGLVNIVDKEVIPMMVAGIIIGAGAGVLANLPFVGTLIGAVMSAIALVVIPATIIVAFKVFMEKAK